MIISSVFLVILISTLHTKSVASAAVVLNSSAELINVDSSNYLSALQHKLDSFTNTLLQIDASVHDLQEKAHTWAIFRHHIDSWNEEIKSLEHKLDLVKRTQDEHEAFGIKLTSLEFTLNHVLSKVVYLSDGCSPSPEALASSSDSHEHDHVEALRDLQRADKKIKNEISTRLSNILRLVQNIENDLNSNKMAKLMLPVDGGSNSNSSSSNASQRHPHTLERSLKTLEQKVNLIVTNMAQKDFKQMHSLAKKNAKSLESILTHVTSTDKRLSQWHEENANGMTDFCQTVSGELTTFTESSDLLLKRMEMLMQNMNDKLNRFESKERANRHEEKETTHHHSKESNNSDLEGVDDEEDDDEEKDIAGTSITESIEDAVVVKGMHDSNDVFKVVEAEYMQPQKLGCHELDVPRVDGIYKFASPEINEIERDFNERFCAFPTDGLAWTVIQTRGPYTDQENFNRSWADYRRGFGKLYKDFWYGNEFIHQLVYRDDYELRIELTDFEGTEKWAEYSVFRMDSEQYNYNLLIGGYRGDVPDAMQYHNEMDFSTYDRRNDKTVDACCACATSYGSGWWFDNCSEANLNGLFHDMPLGHNYVGIMWEFWQGDYSLKRTRMMIRPKKTLPHKEDNNDYTEDP